MKQNRELLVSYCDIKLKKNGDPIYPSIGTALKKISLYDVLFKSYRLESIPINASKGSSGAIFPYVQDKLGIKDNSCSDGIIFIDIDKMPKDEIKTVYEAFDELIKVMPDILSCWYSHSYYDSNKNYGGLHFVLKASDDVIYGSDYSRLVETSGAILCRVIYNTTNIDCRPDGKKGIDENVRAVSHRFFLNHSTVKWNGNAFSVSYICEPQLISWMEVKSKWFSEKSEFKITNIKVNSFVESDNLKKYNLGYENRITILNTLAQLGIQHDKRVSILMSICGEDDYAEGEDNLLRNAIQTSKTSDRRPELKPYLFEKGLSLLKRAGFDIDAVIEQVYQPIEYDIDSIFQEAFDEVSANYVSPIQKNRLEIKLKPNEFLADYKQEITDMILKHKMTYLIADCQVGKTTYALNVQSNPGLFDDDFIVHFSGDSIDVCVPYNSVADNKAKGSRKDIKRVKTADTKNFSLDKRNLFIWNTVVPLYNEYFNNGVVKRLVLFFDESQKIVTDDYRWDTLFEMFKVLPSMYLHFVFMTGTPAGELEFLKQYFDDYCIVKVDKEFEFKRECKILKYKHFGNGDRISLIESTIDSGKLPLIYANSKFSAWRDACWKINQERKLQGLKPYKILDYSRPNSTELVGVNSSNSIKEYDIVLATKYCSVGIDFMKDDGRLRCAIVDYASEHECTFHDIWQFTLRNRNQNTLTKIIVHDNENYDFKLTNYWYYVNHFDLVAKMHTNEIGRLKNLTETEKRDMEFAKTVFQDRKFFKYDKHFETDVRNIKLLGIYYRYVKIFSNMNTIKSMLKNRGVEVTEVDMQHNEMKMSNEIKKDIYDFFVGNYNAISKIHANKGQYDNRSYQIDINSDTVENITDGKIYSRNLHYMDWLIKQFAGKDEWYEVLKDNEILTKDTFATYNYLTSIAKHITKKDIDKIKRLLKAWNEDDINDFIEALVYRDFRDAIPNSISYKEKMSLMADIIKHYKKILPFAIDNIDFIEEIKNAKDNGDRITATHKMKIVFEQKETERIRKAQSRGVTKKNEKPITVKIIANKKIKTFNSRKELAEYLKVDKMTIYRFLKGEKCSACQVIQVIDF